MRRHLIIFLAMLALVATACAEESDATASPLFTESPEASASIDIESMEASPSESAEESFEASFEASESPEATFDADDSSSPEASAEASPSEDDDGGLTAGCEDAFAEMPTLSRIDSLQQLSEVLDALEQTIEQCESVDAWAEEAEQRLDLANIDIDARDFLERQCEDEDLADAPLCEAL